jgi:hypothetical protein
MVSKQNPATLAACGAPVTDLAGASINPDYKSPLLTIQAAQLTRRCAISTGMAEALAPMIFGAVLS